MRYRQHGFYHCITECMAAWHSVELCNRRWQGSSSYCGKRSSRHKWVHGSFVLMGGKKDGFVDIHHGYNTHFKCHPVLKLVATHWTNGNITSKYRILCIQWLCWQFHMYKTYALFPLWVNRCQIYLLYKPTTLYDFLSSSLFKGRYIYLFSLWNWMHESNCGKAPFSEAIWFSIGALFCEMIQIDCPFIIPNLKLYATEVWGAIYDLKFFNG